MIKAATAFFAILLLLFLVMPKTDICSDDVRGYERSASSSLNVSRENFRKVEASLRSDASLKVQGQLNGLTATNFTAIKACDSACKLLAQCLRFVVISSPSEACPTEYNDYKSRTDAVLMLLSKLSQLENETKAAAQKSEMLEEKRKDVADLEQSSGSTGARLALLKAELIELQRSLTDDATKIIAQTIELEQSKK